MTTAFVSWQDWVAAQPPQLRLEAWLEDVLRPVIEDGVVDELESRLLDASWAVYGLTDADAVAFAAHIDAVLTACVRDAVPQLALPRLHSARGHLTDAERTALDEWTSRVVVSGPMAAPSSALVELVRTVCVASGAADPAGAPPVAAPSAPAPPDAAAVDTAPADVALPAPVAAMVVGTADPAAGAAVEQAVAVRPAVPRHHTLCLDAGTGRPPLQVRIATPVNAAMLHNQGEDARFFHPDWQFRLVPREDGWWIEPNLSSPNDTMFNGRALRQAERLTVGDLVGVGKEAKGLVKLPMKVLVKE